MHVFIFLEICGQLKGLIMKKSLLKGLFLPLFAVIATMQADVPQKESPGLFRKAGFEKTIKDRSGQIPFINKLGRAFGFTINPKHDWQDSKGKIYWSIKNKTNYFIKVKSDVHSSLVVAPGKIGRLYRDEDWYIKVELEKEVQPRPGAKRKIKIYKEEIDTSENKEHTIEVYLQYELQTRKIGGTKKILFRRKEKLILKAIK